ncbi:MAG TPA: histone [Candidatus Bathyarchaeota archaeon]|nr:histone [Candidatus Bathyarchaeota archaeon]
MSEQPQPASRVFPMASIHRLLELEMVESRKVNRVSREAIITMHNALMKYGRRIARRAVEYAEKSKRKTVTEDDVKRAIADYI